MHSEAIYEYRMAKKIRPRENENLFYLCFFFGSNSLFADALNFRSYMNEYAQNIFYFSVFAYEKVSDIELFSRKWLLYQKGINNFFIDFFFSLKTQ